MPQNKNPPLEPLKPKEYSDLKLNTDEIILCFKTLHIYIESASEFQHIKMALLQHLKEAVKYLNKSLKLLKQEYTEITLDDFKLKSSYLHINKDAITSIDEIENQIRELISSIDKRVFLIKSFTYSDTKAHARLLASSMTELMGIQHLYIYPYYEDLIPDFLRNIDFKEKNKLKK